MSESLNPAVDFLINDRPRRFPWLNAALFLATCLTTTVVGALLMAAFNETLGDDLGAVLADMWRSPAVLLSGLPFSLSIMAILFSHEMGHYLACRYYRVSASLPYFIPAPTIVGTMGAFIRIRSPIHHRAALLDIGVAGPIAGFVVAIPTLIVAMTQSRFVRIDPADAGIAFGEPLIFRIAAFLMGVTPPEGMDVYLHPIGLAAWFGFFATALNLLPVGQLDGGHIAYALFGRFHRRISLAFVATLIALGILYWPGWLIWAGLLFLIGLRHPVTLDDSIPIQRRHVWLGWIALAMFILCFTPMPFHID